MNMLLDTHVWLWLLSDPDRIGSKVRRWLENPANTVFVSAVSGWEVEVKRALGKLRAPSDLLKHVQALRFTELPLHLRHVEELSRLPERHRDPFDRMLIAQARADDLSLVTHDKNVLAYPVKTIAV